ncbi:MAG: hypothetical protein Kow0069_26010 [Promethearchaeota archaeon]
MAKNYLILAVVVLISTTFMSALLARSVATWRRKRSTIARDLALTIALLTIALALYAWTALISHFDPWGWPYQFQVWLFAVVNECQVVAHYFMFRLTDEIWPVKREIWRRGAAAASFGIVTYMSLGAGMGWGHVPFGENNNDLIPLTYAILWVFYTFVEWRGAVLSFKALQRERERRSMLVAGAGNRQVEESKRQVTAMARILVFFLGTAFVNVVAVLDLVIPDPTLFYASFLIIPAFVLLAQGGFFPRVRPT